MASKHVEDSAHTTGYEPQRLHTGQLEVGVTDAVQQHIARSVVPPRPVSQRKLDFEHSRPRWLREMAAEATGVFFYVHVSYVVDFQPSLMSDRYAGIAAEASFFLNGTEPAFGSLFTIGVAYAFGIAFAIITSASASGGHFNPAITLCLAYWQGFPWKKVPYYIFAQCFGSFMAGLVLVGQYWPQLEALKLSTIATGASANSAGGPGSILCSFPAATQTNYEYLFLIEFFACTFVGIIIWACIDHSNPFMTPSMAPWAIGLSYAVMVWGFADVTISLNLARDSGTRIVAAIFYGSDAFSRYTPLAWLVNIPATFLATTYYEIVMRDSLKLVAIGHGTHEDGDEGLRRHLTKTATVDVGFGRRRNDQGEKGSSDNSPV